MNSIKIHNPEKLYFSSDHHFGHDNIIKHSKRPYTTVHEMNKDLIDRWNKVVPSDAQVVYMGDFTMNLGMDKVLRYMSRLNGKLISVVYGNHDNKVVKSEGYNDIGCDMVVLEIADDDVFGGVQVIHCAHYPILSWYKMQRGSWHLYGHVHNNDGEQHPHPRAFNVGVDVNDFAPISYFQLKEAINSKLTL